MSASATRTGPKTPAAGWRGNPFALVARDAVGASAIDWGVYGVPESYLLDAEGRIVHKHVGPISDADWRGTFEPKLRDLARLTP